jgi:hypothetical protein
MLLWVGRNLLATIRQYRLSLPQYRFLDAVAHSNTSPFDLTARADPYRAHVSIASMGVPFRKEIQKKRELIVITEGEKNTGFNMDARELFGPLGKTSPGIAMYS